MIPIPPELWIICLVAWHAGVPAPLIERLVAGAYHTIALRILGEEL